MTIRMRHRANMDERQFRSVERIAKPFRNPCFPQVRKMAEIGKGTHTEISHIYTESERVSPQ